MPYRITEDSVVSGLYCLDNLYNGEQYWVHLPRRQCDCANYEFVVSDVPGSFCKHLRGVQKWRKNA